VLARLARLLRVDQSELADRIRLCRPGVGQPCWNGSPYRPVPVATDVDAVTLVSPPRRSAASRRGAAGCTVLHR
jgi:hypothetical protein